MSADSNQVRQIIEEARAALRQGDQSTARRLAEQAARLAPGIEEPWLILTVVSEPRASLEYAKRALVINPESQRARKAVDWARNRLGPEGAAEPSAPPSRVETNPLASLPRVANRPAAPAPEPQTPPVKKSNSRNLALAILAVGVICIVVAVAGWSAFRNPAVASILNASRAPVSTATPLGPHSSQFDLENSTPTPEWTFTPSFTPTLAFTFTPSYTSTSTVTLTPEFTFTPLPTDTPAPSDTPVPTETPGQMEAAIVPDTATPRTPPTKAYVAPTQVAGPSSGGSGGARWIEVNLSQQMVYAHEGDTVVNSFLASTGTWQYPTVTGTYHIYVKYISTTMTGPGYNLPNVPYTMYFYKGYGIHGTYWHHNFGVPMSHGCVNLSIPDAQWMYNWASVGTEVNVHY